MKHPRILSVSLLTLAVAASTWAIHPKNAGPESVELKFKLPPPAPLSPEEALKSFKIAPGFKVELFASEPMIECPVAMAWDEKGRAFVLEMRGYMQDIDGKGEDQPNCVVSMLEDTDGDGKADKKTTFAKDLVMARAIMPVNGGLLVAEPPNLFFMKDTDGDGVADVKEVVDNNYGTRDGQPEHMANSPTWTLDNWIHSANHSIRYRFKDGKFIQATSGRRGQWGMTQDDLGRIYYNFNSDFLRANLVPEGLFLRNPNWPGSVGTGVKVVADQSVWPIVPTPGVNRGYEPKALTADGKLKECTATCGASIYRSNLFPKEFLGNAFIPEPAGNLVKRFLLSEQDGLVTGTNSKTGEEFLASTDERFRPVNSYTGPDGALYLVDMYRGIVQHKGFLTHYLVANIKDRKLEQPINMGRIWRVVPEAQPAKAFKGLPSDTTGLVNALKSDNGFIRDTAQRLLVERKDATAVPLLANLVKTGSPTAKIHALWTLEGIGVPAPDSVKLALKDKSATVRANAIRVADKSLAPELNALANDKDFNVQLTLACVAGTMPECTDALVKLARTSRDEKQAGNKERNLMLRDAILSGLRGREIEVLESLLTTGSKTARPDVLAALSGAVIIERKSANVKRLLALTAGQSGEARLALLEGASGKNTPKGARKPKLLYLDSEPAEMAVLATSSTDAKSKPLFAGLDSLVAWPGKPGVPPPPVIPPLNAEQQRLFDIGKTTYNTLCTGCHQPNGMGMDGLAPTLVDSDWVLGNPAILQRVVLHGLTGPIKVNNQNWSLEMPPLGAALTDDQVAGVLTFIRREWEHGASPVSVADVQKTREDNKGRAKAWTIDDFIQVGLIKKDVKK